MTTIIFGCSSDKEDANLDDKIEVEGIDNEISDIDNSFGETSLDDIKDEINSI